MQKDTVLNPCSLEMIQKLREIVQDTTVSPKIAQRAQMILDTLDGMTAEEITGKMRITPGIYFRWVKRFNEKGIAGLWDRPHTGRLPVYDREFEKRVLALLDSPPPEGTARWDGASLAKVLDSSDDAVWRVLRKYHITLARKRVWTMDVPIRDPRPDQHLAGVYLAPPVRLFVLMTGGEAEESGCVITRSRSASEVLRRRAMAGDMRIGEAIAALAAVDAPISEKRRNVEVMEFLQDMARYRGKDARLYVIYTGDLAACGINSWRTGHTWMEFVRLDDLHEASDCFGGVLLSYPDIQSGALSYPDTAPAFRWQRMLRPEDE